MALDLAFLIVLAAVAAGLGLAILRRLGEAPEHPADALALALPLGLGAIALGVLGLGELGAMNAGSIAGLLVVAGMVGLARIGSAGASPCRGKGGAFRWSWAWDTPMAIALLGTLLTALAPVTDGDALCYHLQVPKVFPRVRVGRL